MHKIKCTAASLRSSELSSDFRAAVTVSAKSTAGILGVSLGCGLEEVKAAYYKKAHIYHPDKNPDAKAKEQFNELNKYIG